MTDISSVSVWILLVSLLLDSVYCQISASAGSDVLLECSYTTSNTSKLNVFWRYQEGHNLVDIIDGRMVLSEIQDPRFRDRIITFPEFCTKGNFSVVLKNITLNDAGPYDCNIPKVDFHQRLQLTVTVKPTEGPTTTAEPGVTSPPSGDGVSFRDHAHSFFILSVGLLLSVWVQA